MTLLIAPLEALTDSRLSDPERRVLLALYSFRNKNADTVWPSVDAIAARASVKDKTWISKLTKGLAEKGWLTKKKRGFTGGNEYALMVPEIATKALSNLDSEPNLDNPSNLAPDALSNLDGEPNSNLDSEPKCNELQSEQQKEQQNIKPKKSDLDYSSWPCMPTSQIFRDWQSMRKKKRAEISQTVVDQFGKELTKAVAAGYTVDQCLAECITRNWVGFKLQWIQNSVGAANHAPNTPNRGKTWAERRDDLTDAVTNYERATNF